MKLLIWKVLLKLNSKSYHVFKEKRLFTTPYWKLVTKRIRRFSFFFPPCLVFMRRELARMVENVMWKFQKLNFASSFHQYPNSCEEYFGGEEFKVGTFFSTVPIKKNFWIDQIWTKFSTCSEMVFFSPCIIYKSKVSSLKNVSAVGHVLAILFYYLAFWEAIYVYGLPRGWFRPIVLHELLFYKNTI